MKTLRGLMRTESATIFACVQLRQMKTNVRTAFREVLTPGIRRFDLSHDAPPWCD